MTSFWEKIRRDFSIQGTYLDHAAGGPIPRPVESSLRQYARENAREADFAWPLWMKRLEDSRAAVARFIGAEPDEIAFTHSTSQGMNAIADVLASQGGVLTNDLEFPATTVPWLWRGAEVVFQKSRGGAVPLAEMKGHLKPGIKTLLTSFVQYATGYRQDMKALGRLKGTRYLAVNATQGFGAFPVDVKAWNADFLCTNSYKWMMAGYGGGILYIRKKWLSRLRPAGAGWRSMQGADAMDNRNLRLLISARRYEFGCPAFPPAFAFAAAVEYFRGIGVEKIAGRILELAGFAVEQLQARGFRILSDLTPERRSGILLIEMPGAEMAWKRLLAQNIFVTVRAGGIRLAPHFYNTETEILKFVKALARCRDKTSAGKGQKS